MSKRIAAAALALACAVLAQGAHAAVAAPPSAADCAKTVTPGASAGSASMQLRVDCAPPAADAKAEDGAKAAPRPGGTGEKTSAAPKGSGSDPDAARTGSTAADAAVAIMRAAAALIGALLVVGIAVALLVAAYRLLVAGVLPALKPSHDGGGQPGAAPPASPSPPSPAPSPQTPSTSGTGSGAAVSVAPSAAIDKSAPSVPSEGFTFRRNWGGFGGGTTGWHVSEPLMSLIGAIALVLIAAFLAVAIVNPPVPASEPAPAKSKERPEASK